MCNVLVNDSPRPLTRYLRKAVDSLLAEVGERRLSEFAPGDSECLLADTGWEVQHRATTSPGRTDGTYLLALMAVPSS